ncbi:MAG: hypothetical protein JRJ19_15455, partial [Deltaproteobacteria bacterium]|nr:hypothetical protein [Deltaproteobacteria bacterium]
MKRWGFLACILVVSLTSWTQTASAYDITVDGNPADWTMAAPTNIDTGHIARNASLQGEYIWTDALG